MRFNRAAFFNLSAALVLSLGMSRANAVLLTSYITGEDATSADVVFRVTFDPTVPFSAVATPIITDSTRLDGIDFVPGSGFTEVVVGSNGSAPSIRHYSVLTGLPVPPSHYIADTNTVTGGPGSGTHPSTVKSTPGDFYYIENQFGFGAGPHRIMKTSTTKSPTPTAVTVLDGGAVTSIDFGAPTPIGGGLVNLEGIEIVGGRLYFFAENPTTGTDRALFSIGLTGGGVWDTADPMLHLAGLTEGAPGDGSDELDYDPFTDSIYGSNNAGPTGGGEVIFWDVGASSGGFLISTTDIGAASGPLLRFDTALFDGIRSTGDGFLVLSGIDGVIASVDILGALAGAGDEDINILFDRLLPEFPDFRFDDLTPLTPANIIPEPSTGLLALLGAIALSYLPAAARRRSRQALGRLWRGKDFIDRAAKTGHERCSAEQLPSSQHFSLRRRAVDGYGLDLRIDHPYHLRAGDDPFPNLLVDVTRPVVGR